MNSESPKCNWDLYYNDGQYAAPEFIDSALWRNFERPIIDAEVLPQISKLGTVLENYRIWDTILTQQFIVVRAK